MINQICAGRPLEAENTLYCYYYMRMCRPIWMSKAVLLSMYEHLLPRDWITVRSKCSLWRAHVATTSFSKQVLQWEHESREVVRTWLTSSKGSRPPVLVWRFGTSLLVCLYIRKMTLQEKGWIQILSQMQCVHAGAFVTGIGCRGEHSWKHLLLLLRPNPDHDGSIYTSNISWVNIEILRRFCPWCLLCLVSQKYGHTNVLSSVPCLWTFLGVHFKKSHIYILHILMNFSGLSAHHF